jgi:hypothetical protein
MRDKKHLIDTIKTSPASSTGVSAIGEALLKAADAAAAKEAKAQDIRKIELLGA